MEIVPLNEQVVVDVQVAPTDIDSVALGQKAEVRFSGLNIRSTPATYGNVVSISGTFCRSKFEKHILSSQGRTAAG